MFVVWLSWFSGSVYGPRPRRALPAESTLYPKHGKYPKLEYEIECDKTQGHEVFHQLFPSGSGESLFLCLIIVHDSLLFD